ncbi:MAG: class I SAM-dependent methyltransferase [Anaerolineae bacterium]|jgi:ubiquinone/menaquinone biosynthesis C-methylase UbiE|nr:class I SAM-dependent methyltransferase [Anaerolineae bacterium]MBT3713004.1 class I SAM-dependent methyltransferase [Anaerolineae bacterium]MBT4309460.1 class I SAM-dependent methyltransferase [Anaerolineae bacterium]MBT4458264.1 class I SAM-dependent methyltransferase [Anaerolineae bacterium]MBT4840981.1 class I SAM-dependent methyltransferase [Anaerolineae bacterium]
MTNKEQSSPHIYGNYEDKYNSENIIAKFLMRNFIKNFKKNLFSFEGKSADAVCEVGCGEGELLKIIHAIYPDVTLYASDISEGEIAKAKENCAPMSVRFSVQNAENLDEYDDSVFDLVVCCEVLEHLSNVEKGLSELFRISKKHILLSVPNEPIWKILNVARGKYLRDFGNTPGHINHWNIVQFPKFLSTYSKYSLIERSYPFPWQMVLLKKVTR